MEYGAEDFELVPKLAEEDCNSTEEIVQRKVKDTNATGGGSSPSISLISGSVEKPSGAVNNDDSLDETTADEEECLRLDAARSVHGKVSVAAEENSNHPISRGDTRQADLVNKDHASTTDIARAAVATIIKAPQFDRTHEKLAEELTLSVKDATPAVKLLTSLSAAVSSLQHQSQVQHTYNARMNNINLMLNISNYSKNSALAKKQTALKARLMQGEALVRSMEAEIDTQRQTVFEIQDDIVMHEKTIEQLESELETQKNQVRELSKEYHEELKAQREMIESQQRALTVIQSSKLKQDAIVDAVIVLLAIMAVKSPVVDLPLRVLVSLTGSISNVGLSLFGTKTSRFHRRQLRTSSSLLRILSFVVVARSLRVLAMQKGVHNFVGSTNSYLGLLRQLKGNTQTEETEVGKT